MTKATALASVFRALCLLGVGAACSAPALATSLSMGANPAPEGSNLVLSISVNYTQGASGAVSGTVDWGDGTSSSYSGGGAIAHKYAENGAYTVSFSGNATETGWYTQWVVDYYDFWGNPHGHYQTVYYPISTPLSGTAQVTVLNVAPVVQDVALSGIAEATVPFTFTAQAADAGVNDVLSYAWDFDGDGVTDATGQSAQHAFETPGAHTVAVTVTDDDGGSVKFSKEVSVGALQAPAFESPTEFRGVATHDFHYAFDANRVPTKYTLKGKLPPGLTFNSATGEISGVPRKFGVFSLDVSAENAAGLTHQAFALKIDPLRGAFTALVGEGADEFAGSGLMTLAVTPGGTFTSALTLGGKRYPVNGKFDSAGTFHRALTKAVDAPVLKLSYDAEDLDHIVGELTIGGAVTAFTLNRNPFDKKLNVAPQAGRYTVLLPQPADASLPRGYGFGTVVVGKDGRVTFAGVLGDGTKVAQASALDAEGTWPFFALAYAAKGGVLGTVGFEQTQASDLNGGIRWFKPEISAKGAVHPDAFSADLLLVGSAYVPPPARPVVNLTDTTVKFDLDGAGLFPMVKDIHIENNRVSGPPKSDFVMSFIAPAGLFTGKFFNLNTVKTAPFGGAVFQKQEKAFGQFRQGDQIGFVEVAQ